MGSALKAGWNQQELLAGKPVQEKEEKSTTVAEKRIILQNSSGY